VARKKGEYFSPCFNDLDTHEIARTAIGFLDRNRSNLDYSDYMHMVKTGISETGKFRNEVLCAMEEVMGRPLATLNGVELGMGGDSLIRESITIDRPFPYPKCGFSPINVKGDCRSLPWFADSAFDYLYSSHLFEDFDRAENADVLGEWSRVLKEGGCLALLLPDQRRYAAHCERQNEAPNEHHKIDEFGPEYMISLAKGNPSLSLACIKRFWELPDHEDDYNFLIIFRKIAA
jgi:SAM-dependent methyltransferase